MPPRTTAQRVRVRVRVRVATTADLPALLSFADDLRDQVPGEGGTRGRSSGVSGRAALEARFTHALTDPDRTVVLAVRDTDPEEHLGLALLVVAPATALGEVLAVHMSHAVVADRHRGRGAGKALVAAAAEFADERGIDQLVVSVNPGSREANRFFARLGLVPLAVRRTAPVSVVKRHLAASDPTTASLRRLRRPVRLPPPAGGVVPRP